MPERTTQDFPTAEAAALTLYLQPGSLLRFSPLFQQGFLVKIPGRSDIRTILCGYLGVAPDYLEGRIQTIFLNGKPVDEVDATMAGHGDTLALSAALPGLVGATMRRGGMLAGFRANISHREPDPAVQGTECLVTLKLFNLLTGELGPFFLEKGIWLKGAVLEEFLHRQPADFWAGCLEAYLNGADLDVQALPALAWPAGNELVHLRVTVRPG